MYGTKPLRGYWFAGIYTLGFPYRAARSRGYVWLGAGFYILVVAAVPVLVAFGLSYKAADLVSYKASAAAPRIQASPSLKPKPKLPAATPVEIQKAPDAQLHEMLVAWTAKYPQKQWSIVVQGLGSDSREASVNPDLSYGTASMYKLFLTYSLFQKDTVASLQTKNISVSGRSVKMSDCVVAMLKVSDNACGEAIGRYVGWGSSNTKLKQFGFKNTNLNNPSGPVSTAADTAALLKMINSGPSYTDESRQYILSILKQQTWNKGIPAGCRGCIVANKTGDLSSVRHDAGIIEYPGGKYILSVYTNGASYAQIAQLTAQVQAYMAKK